MQGYKYIFKMIVANRHIPWIMFKILQSKVGLARHKLVEVDKEDIQNYKGNKLLKTLKNNSKIIWLIIF